MPQNPNKLSPEDIDYPDNPESNLTQNPFSRNSEESNHNEFMSGLNLGEEELRDIIQSLLGLPDEDIPSASRQLMEAIEFSSFATRIEPDAIRSGCEGAKISGETTTLFHQF